MFDVMRGGQRETAKQCILGCMQDLALFPVGFCGPREVQEGQLVCTLCAQTN
jgi:hypothetical protein